MKKQDALSDEEQKQQIGKQIQETFESGLINCQHLQEKNHFIKELTRMVILKNKINFEATILLITDNRNEATKIKDAGNFYFKQQRYELAIIFYHRAIELKPFELYYYTNKILALVKLQKLDEADLTFKKAWVKYNSTFVKEDLYLKSKLCFRKYQIEIAKNDQQKMIYWLEQTLQYRPKDLKVKKLLNDLKAQQKS